MKRSHQGKPLDGLNIIVIGAGPGGLAFAKGAQESGATVQVIEKTGDPRGSEAGYTDRSFNLTLNDAGRKSLADERVWRGGSNVTGRAIHNKTTGKTDYASYGEGAPALLTSIPRPLLRQNLITLTEEAGVVVRFNTTVLRLDPDKARLVVKLNNRPERTLLADLVVVADGLHSLADDIIESKLGGSLNYSPEPYNYVTVVLDREACKGLSLEHIHFWHEVDKDALSIGVPNKDGTIAVLMISKFLDVDGQESPFPTYEKSKARLTRDFPRLLEMDPMLAERLTGRLRGTFHYKSITNYMLGTRCVVVGDAGSTIPPWAAFGANAALYGADSLVRFLVGCNTDIPLALTSYEQHMLILEDLVIDFVNKHGKFLMSNEVVEHPTEHSSSPVLGELVNKAVEKTNVPPSVELLHFNETT